MIFRVTTFKLQRHNPILPSLLLAALLGPNPAGAQDVAVQGYCPIGMYNPPGSSTCLPCPSGTYGTGANVQECKKCAAGTYLTSTGVAVNTATNYYPPISPIYENNQKYWVDYPALLQGSRSPPFRCPLRTGGAGADPMVEDFPGSKFYRMDFYKQGTYADGLYSVYSSNTMDQLRCAVNLFDSFTYESTDSPTSPVFVNRLYPSDRDAVCWSGTDTAARRTCRSQDPMFLSYPYQCIIGHLPQPVYCWPDSGGIFQSGYTVILKTPDGIQVHMTEYEIYCVAHSVDDQDSSIWGCPTKFSIYGANDRVTFTEVTTHIVDPQYWIQRKMLSVRLAYPTDGYQYFAFVIRDIVFQGFLHLSEIRLIGYPFQVPCQLCPAGKVSDAGAGQCSCAVGYGESGVDSCSQCAPGFYNDGSFKTCVACPAGKVSSAYGSASCTPCPAGYYSATGSLCQPCPTLTYSRYSGSGTCTPCPAGQYSAFTGSTVCDGCTTGVFSAGSGTCVACAMGSFIALANGCIKCPTGTASTMINAFSCIACNLGTYSVATQTACAACASGTYTNAYPAVACTACPSGTFSPVGASACGPSTCAAGTMPSSGLILPYPPAAFTWMNFFNSISAPYGDSVTLVGQTNILSQNFFVDPAYVEYGGGLYTAYASSINYNNYGPGNLFAFNLEPWGASYSMYTNHGWASIAAKYDGSGAPSPTNNAHLDSTSTYKGEFVVLKLPVQVRITGVAFGCSRDWSFFPARLPKTWKMYGSTDGGTFTEIPQGGNDTPLTSADYTITDQYYAIYTKNFAASDPYNYVGIVVNTIFIDGLYGIHISYLRFFGYAPGSPACVSCPINTTSASSGLACVACPAGYYTTSEGASTCTACAGGTYSTSVGTLARSFRYFGGKTYPPRSTAAFPNPVSTTEILSSSTTYYYTHSIASGYGAGDYKIYVSSFTASNHPRYLFDDKIYSWDVDSFTWGASRYSAGTFSPATGGIFSNFKGDFVVIKFPRQMQMSGFGLVPDSGNIAKAPALWKWYGSNDGQTFEDIPAASNSETRMPSSNYTTSSLFYVRYLTKPSKPYTYFALVVNQLAGSETELRLYEIHIFSFAYTNPLPATNCYTCASGTYSPISSTACTRCVIGKTSGVGYSACTPIPGDTIQCANNSGLSDYSCVANPGYYNILHPDYVYKRFNVDQGYLQGTTTWVGVGKNASYYGSLLTSSVGTSNSKTGDAVRSCESEGSTYGVAQSPYNTNVCYLNGSTYAKVEIGKLPASFTVCVISRWAKPIIYGRIISGVPENFELGHSEGGGYGDIILSGTVKADTMDMPPSNPLEWMVACVSNAASNDYVYRNGKLTAAKNGGGSGPTAGVCVNCVATTGYNSNFAIADYVVLDSTLSSATMRSLGDELFKFKQFGNMALLASSVPVPCTPTTSCGSGRSHHCLSDGSGSVCCDAGEYFVPSTTRSGCKFCPGGTYSNGGMTYCLSCPLGVNNGPRASSCCNPWTTLSADGTTCVPNTNKLPPCQYNTAFDPIGKKCVAKPGFVDVLGESYPYKRFLYNPKAIYGYGTSAYPYMHAGTGKNSTYDAFFERVLQTSLSTRYDSTYSEMSKVISTDGMADASVPAYFLQGTTSLRMDLGILPPTYTVCAVTRYPKGATSMNGILKSDTYLDDTWYLGHGLPSYGDGVNFGANYYKGDMNIATNQWNVYCANNGAAGTDYYYHNGALSSNTRAGGISPSKGIFINTYSNPSQWALADYIVWDRVLDGDTMRKVGDSLNQFTQYGNLALDMAAVGVPCSPTATCLDGSYHCLLDGSGSVCCAAGTYYSQRGVCAACGAGSFGAGTDTACTTCTAGFYSPAQYSTACTGCPAGSWTAGAGATSCSTCYDLGLVACPSVPGTYRGSNNALLDYGPRLCPVNHFCPLAVQWPIACPSGSVSNVSASACSTCPGYTCTAKDPVAVSFGLVQGLLYSPMTLTTRCVPFFGLTGQIRSFTSTLATVTGEAIVLSQDSLPSPVMRYRLAPSDAAAHSGTGAFSPLTFGGGSLTTVAGPLPGTYGVRFSGPQKQYASVDATALDLASIQTSKGLSFSMWFRAEDTTTGPWAQVFQYGAYLNGTAVNYIGVGAYSGNRISAQVGYSDGTWRGFAFYDYYVDSQWHHLVWAISTAGRWYFYLDNTYIDPTLQLPVPNVSDASARRLYVGQSVGYQGTQAGYQDYMTFSLFDFAVFSAELSQPQAWSLYQLTHTVLTMTTTYQSFRVALQCASNNVTTYTLSSGNNNSITLQSPAFCPAPTYFSACGCRPGRILVAATQSCQSCPTGTYSTGINVTACLNCSVGTFGPIQTASSCTACYSGTFQSLTGQSACPNCDKGRYVSTAGMTTCQVCQKGTYSILGLAASACTLCPYGTYGTGSGFGDVLNCTACPLGAYQYIKGSTECLLCSDGQFASAAGSMLCEYCRAGTYSTGSGKWGCANCSIGSYSPVYGSLNCTQCWAGTYQSWAGSYTCTPCDGGLFATGTGLVDSSTCLPCLAGFYTPISSSSCVVCPPSSYGNSMAASACLDCGAGSYSTGTGFTSPDQCATCPVATYRAVGNATACSLCQAGSYSPISGVSACIGCDTGSYGTARGGVSPDSCRTCPVTYYCPTPKTPAMPCLPGNTANGSATSCFQCQGYTCTGNPSTLSQISMGSGLTLNFQCTLGTGRTGYIDDGSGQPAGIVSGEALVATANDIPQPYVRYSLHDTVQSGSSGDAVGPLSIRYTYLSSTFEGLDKPLPGVGYTLYLFSQSGQFLNIPTVNLDLRAIQRTTGITLSIWLKFSGRYFGGERVFGYGTDSDYITIYITGGTNIIFHVYNSNTQIAATYVPDRTVVDSSWHHVVWTISPTGVWYIYIDGVFINPYQTFDISVDHATNPHLYIGKLYDSDDFSVTPAPMFAYDFLIFRTELSQHQIYSLYQYPYSKTYTVLNVNSTIAGTSTRAVLLCGYEYSSYATQQPPGSGNYTITVRAPEYCSDPPLLGLSSCTCPAGTAAYPGSRCSPCDAGTYSSDPTATACTACPSGSYNSAPRQPNCTACAVGYFASGVGYTACQTCFAGTYSSQVSTQLCTACPSGAYTSTYSQTACRTCSAGTFSTSSNHTGCTVCPAGTYLPSEGSFECALCPAQTFLNKSNFTGGTVSPPNFYPPTTGYDGAATPACPSSQDSNRVGDIFGASGLRLFKMPITYTSGYDINTYYLYTDQIAQSGICSINLFDNALYDTGGSTCPKSGYWFNNYIGNDRWAFSGDPNNALVPGNPGRILVIKYPFYFIPLSYNMPGPLQFFGQKTISSSVPLQWYLYGSNDGVNFRFIDFQSVSYAAWQASKTLSVSLSSRTPYQYFGFVFITAYYPTFTICEIQLYGSPFNHPCQPCPPNSASPSGASACFACTAGSYSERGACLSCNPGTYSTSGSVTACSLCALGQYASSPQRTACQDCQITTFSGSPGSINCSACPLGTFGASTNASACAACLPGTYSNSRGASACVGCDAGSYGTTTGGNSSLSACPAACPATYACPAGSTWPSPCPDNQTANASSGMCYNCYGYTCLSQTPVSVAFGSPTMTLKYQCNLSIMAGTVQNSVGTVIGNVRGETTVMSLLTLPQPYVRYSLQNLLQTGTSASLVGNLVTVNSPSLTSGTGPLPGVGGTLQLISASAQFVSIPAANLDLRAIQQATGITIAFWFKLSDTNTGSKRIFGYSDDILYTTIYLTASTQLRFHIYNGNHKAYTSPSSIIDNLWHHVAWTIASSATNAWSVYIDGVYHNTQVQHDIGDITTRNLFIGSLFTTAGDSDYRPTMQAYDFMIFQSELTQHQIISLYSRPTYTLLRVDGLQGLTFRILLQCSSNAAQYYNLVDVNTNSLTLSSPSYCSQQPTFQYSSCYCPMGMFNTGPNQCLPCPAGTYGTAPSITACASCPDGTYTPYQQQTTCLACSSRTYSTGANHSSCGLCAAGTYSTSYTAPICVNCPAGTFLNRSNVSYASPPSPIPCDACPAEYTSVPGATVCFRCGSGSYSLSTNCFPCDNGTYSTSGGNSTCTACAPGYYGPGQGLSACLLCPAGTYGASQRQSACAQCQAGAYSPVGTTACGACPVGMYAYPNTSACVACPAGYFCSQSTGKYPCPAGYYCPERTSGNVLPSDLPATVAYYPFKAGSPTVDASGNGNSLTVATSGQTPCPLSTTMGPFAGAGSLACANNNYGYVTPSFNFPITTGFSVCLWFSYTLFSTWKLVIDGLHYNPGAGWQYIFMTGNYGGNSGLALDPVTQNWNPPFATNKWTHLCLAMNSTRTSGWVNGSFAGTVAGTYLQYPTVKMYIADQLSHSTPDAYIAEVRIYPYILTQNQVTKIFGLSSQIPGPGESTYTGNFTPCPAAAYCPPGSNASTPCPSGTFNNLTQQSACASCPLGTFSYPNSTSCSACPPGTSSSSNQVSCADCAAGYYSSSYGTPACVACSQGTYNLLARQTGCLDCPPGFTCVGPDVPRACEPGYYCPPGSIPTGATTLLIPTAYYPFKSPAPTADATGNGYDLTPLSGSAVCTPSASVSPIASGSSLYCDGNAYKTGYISPLWILPSDTAGISVCLWYMFKEMTYINGRSLQQVTFQNTIAIYDNELIKIDAGLCGNASSMCINPVAPYFATAQPNVWYHSCVVFNSTYAQAYVNGVLVGTQNASAPTFILNRYVKFYFADQHFGFWKTSVGSSFSGYIAEGRVYNWRISAQDAYALYMVQSQQSNVTSAPPNAPYECPAGYFCPAGSNVSTRCPAGNYGNQSRLTACLTCPYGSYGVSTGATSCQGCPSSTYGPALGSTSCLTCGGGTYSLAPGGQSACTACSAGYICSSASAPRLCDAGYYSLASLNQTATTWNLVYPCLPGTACPPGSSAPKTCVTGTYAPYQNQSSCYACPAGTFGAGAGLTNASDACMGCFIGSYCPNATFMGPCTNKPSGNTSIYVSSGTTPTGELYPSHDHISKLGSMFIHIEKAANPHIQPTQRKSHRHVLEELSRSVI